LIDLLNKNPTWTLHIRGHVCCGPSEKISKKRAKNVYKYLKHAGISPERLTYKGYSDSLPKAFPEKTEADEAQNRRVDFIIHKH
jgi:outer membrane protein OmpA-like peptidoglycan-associated protein